MSIRDPVHHSTPISSSIFGIGLSFYEGKKDFISRMRLVSALDRSLSPKPNTFNGQQRGINARRINTSFQTGFFT